MEVTNIDYEIFSLPKKEVRILDKYMFNDEQLRLKIKWKLIISVQNVGDITQKGTENDMKQLL